MKRRLTAFGVLLPMLIAASSGEAAVSLSLIPDAPAPYFGGETINIDVFLVNEGEGLMRIRLIQLDVSLSDPALELGDVVIDTSSLVSPALYGDFSSGSVTNLTVTSTPPGPGFVLEYGEGLNHIASFPVTLPLDPGQYILDVANSQAPDINTGALIQWDFQNTQTAWSGDGSLGGGRIVFIPEPATMALLFAGGLFAARRRR